MLRSTAASFFGISALIVGPLTADAAAGTGTCGGGVIIVETTFTTSTTHHTTYTDVTLPTLEAFETRVSARLDGSPVFDESVADASGSGAAAALVASARAVLVEGGADTIAGPDLVASDVTTAVELVGAQFNHDEQTVTTTPVFGPATIFIGEDQTVPFFVEECTVNYNTNTHTETFIDNLLQPTETRRDHLLLIGTTAATPPPSPTPITTPPAPAPPGPATLSLSDVATDSPSAAPVATALVRQPRTTG